MNIRYEINPPKVIQNTVLSHDKLEDSLTTIKKRVSEISQHCNGIHLTDSVLGIPRISPITTGALIRNENKNIKITSSIRLRDRNITSLTQSICDAVLLDLNGVLLLKGDPPPEGPKDSKLIPSKIVRYLRELGFNKKIDLFMSLPSNPDFDKIQKKIEAEPAGFVTQVISSIDQVSRIVDKLKPEGFRIIPCVLMPSEKNANSAQLLKLDWSEYENSVIDFIKKVHQIAGDILITSPNDYNHAKNILAKLE